MSPPFDEERYKALTSGLEIKEIRYKALSSRLDSEHYTANPHTSDSVAYVALGDEAERITQGSNPRFSESGLICLNGKNVYWGTMTAGDNNYVDEDEFERLSSFALRPKDIVITLKHASRIGRAWIVEGTTPRIFGRNIGLVRLAPHAAILPEYLLFYLWTKYGQDFLDHNTTGGTSGQITLSISILRTMPIPNLSMDIQLCIKNLYEKAVYQKDISVELYAAAESRLLFALGMEDFALQSGPVAVKNLSESFNISGRLDAEYYQGKYEAIETLLDGKTKRFTIHDSSFLPEDETKYKYIELSDVGTSGNITGATFDIGSALPTRARRKVKSGQVIVSSVEGSLASCALITDEYHGALCSTGFYVIDSAYYTPETLLVLFKSPPMQALIKKRCSGTILTSINKDFLVELPLPVVDTAVQETISAKIQQTFALRRQSDQLLNQAKRAVEIAIEQGEETAIAWLKGKGVER